MDHPHPNTERVKGPWSPEEDELLLKLVRQHGARNWSLISREIPARSGKSCRLRWCNQLCPGVEHRPFTQEEDEIIVESHAKYGNKWATIARFLNGRTDNAIKNHWNSTLKRKYAAMVDEEEVVEEQEPVLKKHVTTVSALKSPMTSPSGSNISDGWVPAMTSSSPEREIQQQQQQRQQRVLDSLNRPTGVSCMINRLPAGGTPSSTKTIVPDVDDVSTELTLSLAGSKVEVRELPEQDSSRKESPSNGQVKTIMFEPILLALIQKMIRHEVRNYMAESCLIK